MCMYVYMYALCYMYIVYSIYIYIYIYIHAHMHNIYSPTDFIEFAAGWLSGAVFSVKMTSCPSSSAMAQFPGPYWGTS